MSDDLERKGISVTVEIWQSLTDQKRGNQTYSDVIAMLFEKAGIPLSEMK